MNLLIVDDEVIAISAIMNTIDWDMLPLDQILTANSFQQAVQVFAEKPVDIVLCDIEMPQGNGLELIEWINKFYPLTINIILSCHDEFDFAKQAVRLECIDYILKPASADKLVPLLQQAITQAQEQVEYAHFQELGQQYQKYIESVAGEAAAEDDVVEQIRQYIINHVSEDLSVSSLANKVFLSPDHLSRTFKRRYGKSMIDFIVDFRLDLAARLLQDKGMHLTDIAEKVGFSNYPYFVKQFKKKFSMSPKEYRG